MYKSRLPVKEQTTVNKLKTRDGERGELVKDFDSNSKQENKFAEITLLGINLRRVYLNQLKKMTFYDGRIFLKLKESQKIYRK